MASKGKEILVMPEEFVTWVRELTRPPFHEHIVLRYLRGEEYKLWDGTDETILAAMEVNFTGALADIDEVRKIEVIPGLLGWVIISVPTIVGTVLYSARMAAKSDWWDFDLEQKFEKKDAILRYDRIMRIWKPRLKTHVGIEHLPSRNREPVTGWAYSAGAEAWYRQGGLLRQEGNNYSNFFPLEPAEVEAIKAKKRAAPKKNTR